MDGLLGDLLPSILSGGNAVRKRLKGLLGDPRAFLGEMNEDAKTAQDQRSALFYQTFGKIDPGSTLPQSDPAFVQQQAQLGRDQLQNMVLNGLTVWHGSPHKFDKFDMSKIGTGEGAQVYGHGLYLAESPATAKWYAESLAGKQFSPSDLVSANGVSLKELMKDAPPLARAKITSYVTDAQGDMAKANSNFDAFVQQQLQENSALTDAGKAVLSEAQGWMKKLADAKISFAPKPTGNLYKVDLPDEAIAKMLDWDKPLTENKSVTQHILKEFGYLRPNDNGPRQLSSAMKAFNLRYGGIGDTLSGKTLWKAAIDQKGSPEAATEYLKSIGIPGIKYFDGNSRGAGQGTRNFVVFDDQLPKILERNGGLLGK